MSLFVFVAILELAAPGWKRVDLTVGDGASAVVAADLNGDKKHHEASDLVVLLNDGKGRFRAMPGSPFAVRSKPHPHGIAAGDWNGDGKIDLALDSWQEDQVELIFGSGDRFRSAALIHVGRHPYQRLRSADVDGDHKADLLITNFRGANVTVLLSKNQQLTEASGSPFATETHPFALATGDVDRDGRLDIVTAHFSGQGNDPSKDAVAVSWGDGKGGFRPGKKATGFAGTSPTAIAAGDLDGDGYADAATGNFTSNDVTLLRGGKDGLRFAERLPAGKNPGVLTIADLDSDGKNDLVVSNSGEATITLWFATP